MPIVGRRSSEESSPGAKVYIYICIGKRGHDECALWRVARPGLSHISQMISQLWASRAICISNSIFIWEPTVSCKEPYIHMHMSVATVHIIWCTPFLRLYVHQSTSKTEAPTFIPEGYTAIAQSP